MLRLYTDLYRRICKYSAELTLQIYDDIILRGCTLPCGYIVSAKDLDLQYYPKATGTIRQSVTISQLSMSGPISSNHPLRITTYSLDSRQTVSRLMSMGSYCTVIYSVQ